MHSVYLVTNKTNGKVYVGQTSQKPNCRWNQHWSYRDRPGDNAYFHNALSKSGREAFSFEILAGGLTKPEADNLEALWIITLRAKSRKHGYNLTRGGEGTHGYHHTSEARALMSQQRTGRKRTPDSIARTAAGNRGQKRTPEQCRNISISLKGREITPEWAQNIRVARNRPGVEAKRLAALDKARIEGRWPRLQREDVSDEDIQRLHSEGLASRETAFRLGCGKSTINHRLNKLAKGK